MIEDVEKRSYVACGVCQESGGLTEMCTKRTDSRLVEDAEIESKFLVMNCWVREIAREGDARVTVLKLSRARSVWKKLETELAVLEEDTKKHVGVKVDSTYQKSR